MYYALFGRVRTKLSGEVFFYENEPSDLLFNIKNEKKKKGKKNPSHYVRVLYEQRISYTKTNTYCNPYIPVADTLEDDGSSKLWHKLYTRSRVLLNSMGAKN